MKYISLIYEQADIISNMPGPEHEALIEQHIKLQAAAKQKGAYVSAVELKRPPTAKSLRVRDAEPMISDGPFCEAKEWFVGFYLFDCPTLTDAQELAGMIPTGQGGGIEVRPLDDSVNCVNDSLLTQLNKTDGKSHFALLNYHPEVLLESYSDEVMQEMIASNVNMSRAAAANGDYIGGYKLMPTATSTTLKGENGFREITDGPFCESKEVLLGLHLLTCSSQQAALDYSKTLDGAITGTVEVRPIQFHQQYPDFEWNSKH